MDKQPVDESWQSRLRAWWSVASLRFTYRYLMPYGVPLYRIRYHAARWRFHARQRAKAKCTWMPWSRIRVVGNSPAVRVAAAIPFVGYIILLNDRLAEFIAIYPDFNVFSTATPWNLLFLYFGSIITGLGAIVYAIRGPDFLTRYAIFAEYRNAERELWLNPAFGARKRARLEAEIRRDVSDGGMPGVLSSRNHRAVTSLQELTADPAKVDDFLFREWEVMDESRPAARIICTLLYGAGLLLLAGPSLLTFGKVTLFTLRRLW